MRFLVYVIPLVLLIYCWIEIAQSDRREVRQLPRGVWALVVLIPVLGPVAWLVYGRPNGRASSSAPKPRPRVVAPDDDPDFLRSLRKPPQPPPGDSPGRRRPLPAARRYCGLRR